MFVYIYSHIYIRIHVFVYINSYSCSYIYIIYLVLIRFGALVAGETLPFSLVLRDPLGNSFIGSSEYENPADDPQMTVSERARGGGGYSFFVRLSSNNSVRRAGGTHFFGTFVF